VNQIEQRLLGTLLELEQAVEHGPAANPKPDLPAIFGKLDALARQLPATTDRQLLHYLERKSYQKARAHLQQRA